MGDITHGLNWLRGCLIALAPILLFSYSAVKAKYVHLGHGNHEHTVGGDSVANCNFHVSRAYSALLHAPTIPLTDAHGFRSIEWIQLP